MSNLLKTELYKLFHSWYFWGIGIFNLLLSSILLLDSNIVAQLSRQKSKIFIMN